MSLKRKLKKLIWKAGYDITSFTPTTHALARRKHILKYYGIDTAWDVFNFALGDKDEQALINISANSQSSSIENLLPALLDSAPEARYVGKETIEVKRLDSRTRERDTYCK